MAEVVTKAPVVDVAVLAGGPPGGPVAEAAGVPHRMLVAVDGQPMVVRVLERLRQAATLGRIVVAAEASVQAALPAGLADEVVPGEGTFIENLAGLAKAIGPDRPMLAVTGDLALVTPAALDDYVGRCVESGATVCYCAIDRADQERMFPGGARTYVKVRGSQFTGGNATWLGPGFVQDHQALIQRLFDARKQPVAIARVLGPLFVLRLLAGLLTLEAVERQTSRILGAPARVIISHYAELGFDVDKLEDLETLRLRLHAGG